MDENARREDIPNKPIDLNLTIDVRSAKIELSSQIASNPDALDQRLDFAATCLFNFIKIIALLFLILIIFLISYKIYIQQGVVILPFEISKNENVSGIAIADQITAELMRIKWIHNIENNKGVNLEAEGNRFVTSFSSEHSLGNQEMVVPKTEFVEFAMKDIGTINVGSNSLSLGNIITAFKNICPHSNPNVIIRGSLQRYGPNIAIVAILEGDDVQSWTVRQSINKSNEEQLPEMITNLSFMIAHDLPGSNVSAKTWMGLKYNTEALDAYHQYAISRDLNVLSQAGDYSLEAIRSEIEYRDPFSLLLLLELTYAEMGMQNDATKYCSKTIELFPASAYGWFNYGYVLSYLGYFNSSIMYFDEAIRLAPNYVNAWGGKGLSLYNLGKHDEDIKCFDEALRLDPNYAAAWNGKGLSLYDQGKYDDAIKAYNEAILLDSTYALFWYNKGNAFGAKKNYEEAVKCFDEVIRLDPNYVDAWNNKGNVFVAQNNYNEAIECFNEAIRLNPKHADAWNNKGAALFLQDKYDEAITCFEEVIGLDPNYMAARNNKKLALQGRGSTAENDAHISKAMAVGD